VRQIRSRLLGGAIILGYHRISAEGQDPFSMSVSPTNFVEQLAVIRDLATPIALPALVQGLREGELPRHTVALTMDDGYADNLYKARPLLERYEMPATIFVISGYLGQEFWWDELARLVLTEGAFADGICLKTAGQEFAWRPQQVGDLGKQREQLLENLYWRIRPLSEQERQGAMQQLKSWVGAVPVEKPLHLSLNVAELQTLADCPLIEIGSHTDTHPALADLASNEQEHEIEHSRTKLTEITGRDITGFSFPNGSYSATTQKMLKNAAYTYACCSDQDTAQHIDQCYQLPRLWVPNVAGEEFGRWLRHWLQV
jgi:peptidoglycan/xylan/chitin deacetylase (PgdA/CDA1 family)